MPAVLEMAVLRERRDELRQRKPTPGATVSSTAPGAA